MRILAGATVLAVAGLWMAVAAAQGVDFMQNFNAANQAAIEQARTANLNSALGVNGERPPWPDVSEADLDRRPLTLAELKVMVMSDRQRAQAMLEGRVVTVYGQAGKPNRWGTWMFLRDPEVRFSARGEWARAVRQPPEGVPLALRGRVTRLQAGMVHLEEPQILR